MRRLFIILVALALPACDTDPARQVAGGEEARAAEQIVEGVIAPDTVYRGRFYQGFRGICGLLLIEAGSPDLLPEIQFEAMKNPPRFTAGNGIFVNCSFGNVTVMDLVTGQSHLAKAPRELSGVAEFAREYIGTLLL